MVYPYLQFLNWTGLCPSGQLRILIGDIMVIIPGDCRLQKWPGVVTLSSERLDCLVISLNGASITFGLDTFDVFIWYTGNSNTKLKWSSLLTDHKTQKINQTDTVKGCSALSCPTWRDQGTSMVKWLVSSTFKLSPLTTVGSNPLGLVVNKPSACLRKVYPSVHPTTHTCRCSWGFPPSVKS